MVALAGIDEGEAFRAFNLGTETGHSVREVLQAVERVSGRARPSRRGSPPAGRPARGWWPPPRGSAQELGFAPRLASLDAIVETALRWRVDHPQGYAASAPA